MPTRAHTLRAAASYLALHPLWTGPQFAGPGGRLSITAALYHGAVGEVPGVFTTDENASLTVIRAHDGAMAAIAFLSACLDTPATPVPGRPDQGLYDPIEHIEAYAAHPPLGATAPREDREVIGRILRAAAAADAMDHTNPAHSNAA